MKVKIEPPAEGKGRTFTSDCLATIEADFLWSGGRGNSATNEVRPVFSIFVGSDNQIKPFITNLLLGRKAIYDYTSYRRKDKKLYFLKSTKYKTIIQKEVEGTIATIIVPDLFNLDPGMIDTTGSSFIILPTKTWCKAQSIDPRPILDYIRKILSEEMFNRLSEEFSELIPISHLFCAYLDRRTRCPLICDSRFYLQVLLYALSEGLASWPISANYHPYGNKPFGENRSGFIATGLESFDFCRCIAFSADHVQLESFLATQVEIYFNAVR